MSDTEHIPEFDPGVNAMAAVEIDTSVPHTARMYNYYLGGKDYYEVDQEAAEAVLETMPETRPIALANRDFLGRVVRFLAKAGIRQFLDIGTGIPGPGNTNEVAHEVAPDARIVYVDNDPTVITHARALLTGADAGRTTVINGDLRKPESILGHPELCAVLDLTQPVAVLLVAVLHFIPDEADPQGTVERLKAAMPPGSYMVISHATPDFEPRRAAEVVDKYKRASAPLVPRTKREVDMLFSGLEYVEPGLVQVPWWRPDRAPDSADESVWLYGGVGYRN